MKRKGSRAFKSLRPRESARVSSQPDHGWLHVRSREDLQPGEVYRKHYWHVCQEKIRVLGKPFKREDTSKGESIWYVKAKILSGKNTGEEKIFPLARLGIEPYTCGGWDKYAHITEV